MKLAFSTLACPDFGWRDILAMAKDLGFDGIEVRGLGAAVEFERDRPFAPESIDETIAQLKAMRLTIPCLSSGRVLTDAASREENRRQLEDYIALAQKLGTPYVRALGDRGISPEGEVDDGVLIEELKALLPLAEEKGVCVLIETNGVYADSARLARVLTAAGSDNVGALWDYHHTVNYGGESPEQTVQNLGAYIRYIHAKDSVLKDGKPEYRFMGEGDLPIPDIMRALNSINFSGTVSLEWVKRWAPELSDAGVVFPHFYDYMLPYLGGAQKSRKLFETARGGKYVWEKDALIDLTFPQVLDRMVEEFPDQYAFRYTTLDYTRTYKEFRDDVDAFARALLGLGVKKGSHVAIWATNVPAWYLTFWAATKIGAVLVTVNTSYKIHEAEYLLRQSDTHTLVMVDGYKDSDYISIIHEICPELDAHEAGAPLHAKRLPFLRNVITVESRSPGCLTWDDALACGAGVPQETVDRLAASMDKNDICNMQYTSGTTGFPKGVMLTHYNIVNNGKCIGDCMDFSTEDRLMIQVPMFHCFGMVLAMTAAMTHGVTLSPIPAFSPKVSLDCIQREKITAFHGVPTMFIAMLEHEDFESTDFSHMRTGIMAGSPCPIKVMQDVVDKMHMTEITIVFGQTESSPGCTQSRADDPIEWRVNTVGRELPGVECRIVDPETNVELGVNEVGEFVARGYNIMKGYYKMPAATAAVIDADGWLHTGDLALKDENGNYKITGRLKDMIIRGGENIYPKEIEDFLYTHEKISDVQVIGVPDKQYGEEIMAWVIVKEGEALSEEDVKDYVRTHMAKHKTPRYVHFVDAFPMNGAGKILKYKMRDDAVELLGLGEAKLVETA
ncbi:MAG: AMP-binding protein [Clostridiales Family XIII bacterium]|jgi:fatty-acyl-CoA synthase|nr:AMP-binding protein [Clostridiales Family XIII bacterium]